MSHVTIPVKWLNELLDLCGPEDHELRERVMKSAAPAAPAVDALDAARLDWLEEQAKQSPTGISFDYVLHAEDGQVLEKGWRFMRRHFLGERKSNLRAAIDAAQAAAKGAA